MGTELAEAPSTDLQSKEDLELGAEALAGIDKADLVLPVIKLMQGQSGEVQRSEAETGEFVNSLTAENYGESFDLIISSYFKGRFYAPENEDGVYVASSDVVPSNWPEQWAGKRFDEVPEAEEQHKARANDPDDSFEWGKGPLIQTTHNYIGFRPEEPGIPVRLSLKGVSSKAHRKIASLLKFGGTPWASTIHIASQAGSNKKGQPYSFVVATQGRQTTPEEREAAKDLFLAQRDVAVKLVGDVEDTPKASAPKRGKGGVDVA